MTKTLVKKVEGTYTRMLRRVKNVSWRVHLSNEQLYGPIPKLSATIKRRRLTLAGHVSRHNEHDYYLLQKGLNVSIIKM